MNKKRFVIPDSITAEEMIDFYTLKAYSYIMNTRLSVIRKKTNLSQAQFAKKYRIPVRTLQEWEQGRKTPPDYVIRLIEKVVNNEDITKYTIMYKNIPVLKLIYQGNRLLDSTLLTDNKLMMPIIGTIDEMRVYNFFKSRCYEDDREDLSEILAQAGLSDNNPWKWVAVTHGVTYEDFWWVKINEEDVEWEQVKVR